MFFYQNRSVPAGELKPSFTLSSKGLAVGRKGLLLVFALVVFLFLVSSEAVAQAADVPNATSALNIPAPLARDLSAAQTQTWPLAVLVIFSAAVYIALFFLILKNTKRVRMVNRQSLNRFLPFI